MARFCLIHLICCYSWFTISCQKPTSKTSCSSNASKPLFTDANVLPMKPTSLNLQMYEEQTLPIQLILRFHRMCRFCCGSRSPDDTVLDYQRFRVNLLKAAIDLLTTGTHLAFWGLHHSPKNFSSGLMSPTMALELLALSGACQSLRSQNLSHIRFG